MLLGSWMNIGFLSIGFGGSKYIFMFFGDLKFFMFFDDLKFFMFFDDLKFYIVIKVFFLLK